MKATLESTTKIVDLNGVAARIWEGETESGIPIHAFITRVAVKEGRDPADYEQFERELQECAAPSVDVAGLPLSLII